MKPAAAIWSSMSSQLRAHSPCGAKVSVSNPNQFTPVRMTSSPSWLTIFAPSVVSGPLRARPWRPAALGPETCTVDTSTAATTIKGTAMTATRPIMGSRRNRSLIEKDMILQ